jgi:hypothetical protein
MKRCRFTESRSLRFSRSACPATADVDRANSAARALTAQHASNELPAMAGSANDLHVVLDETEDDGVRLFRRR